MRPGRATVRVPGTCGELVQGTLCGVAFHVTCPVDLYSIVEAELAPHGGVVYPPDSPKAGLAARLALQHLAAGCGVRVGIRSELLRSKGMASSTADVVGAITATALALGTSLDAPSIARLALEVEPTDGSLFPGIVLFDHRRGTIYQKLGVAPPLAIVALDFGGEVDTVRFNSVDRSALLASLEPTTSEALRLVRRGVAEGRPDLLGRGATLSALANQQVLPKPELPAVLDLAARSGALGVCVGHSGTVIGLLLDPASDVERVIALARRDLAVLKMATSCRLIGGGIEILDP